MLSKDPTISLNGRKRLAPPQRSAIAHTRLLLLAALAVFTMTLGANARAATITVNSLADGGGTRVCTLRSAITAANKKVATNRCPAGNGNDTINFSVKGTITLASALPPVTDNQLTINGPASPGITIDGGGKVQVMQVASGVTLSLAHLAIADGNQAFGFGGGIDNEGTLTVSDGSFTQNVFSGLSDSVGGGAISNEGKLIVNDSTFSGNGALGNGATGIAGNGGSILNFGTLTVIRSSFSKNNTGTVASGGAIHNEGTSSVISSTFSDNIAAPEGPGSGGAIFNSGTLTIAKSTFSGNASGFGDGGAIENKGMLAVINSTFSANSTKECGGSIASGFLSGTATIVNSTFSGNVGGFDCGGGGDISGSAYSLKSTIVAGKAAGGNCVGNTDLGYNISDDDSCGFSAVGSRNNTDPMLDPAGLANNGGPTQTIALLSGSPAIDAIPLADCTDQSSNRITTDQRGFPRPDARGEPACDIGAYESGF